MVTGASDLQAQSAIAEPDKRLFIDMLTRDIELVPAILDLWDNSIDAALGKIQKFESDTDQVSTGRYLIEIKVGADLFEISDNCGGMAVDTARNYAFRFGRSNEAPTVEGAVGSFGVGLKRALFKIGRHFYIDSRSATGKFIMDIDVDHWADTPGPWMFPFKLVDEEFSGKDSDDTGMLVRITELLPLVAIQFESVHFLDRLKHELETRRPEAYRVGIETRLNDQKLAPFEAALAVGDSLHPLVESFRHESGVEIRLLAGVVNPSVRHEDEDDASRFSGPDYAGWYVIANGRVLLAGDKSRLTGWGDQTASYHPQYRNFRGYVDMRAEDGRSLPWNTTKTGIDESSPVWNSTYSKMRAALSDVQALLNRVKKERTEEKESGYRGPILKAMTETQPKPIAELNVSRSRLKYPREDAIERPARDQQINFRIDPERYRKALEVSGATTAAELGRMVFDYYWEAEVEG